MNLFLIKYVGSETLGLCLTGRVVFHISLCDVLDLWLKPCWQHINLLMVANSTYTVSRLSLFLTLLPAYQAWVDKRLAGNTAGRKNPNRPREHLISYDVILINKELEQECFDFQGGRCLETGWMLVQFILFHILLSVPFPLPLSFHILIYLISNNEFSQVFSSVFFPDPNKG